MRPGAEVELEITGLGATGDGIGQVAGHTVRMDRGLPGERWRAGLLAHRRDGWDAEPLDRLAGGERATPACRHFGLCGGCRLQHLPDPLYRDFKRQRIETALRRRGFSDVAIMPPRISPPGSRRRLRLAWERRGRQVVLGLHRRRSHEIVDLGECPVAAPALIALLPAARRLLGGLELFGRKGELGLTVTAGGVDILADAARPPTLDERQALAESAGRLRLARLSLAVGGSVELVAALRPAAIELAGLAVPLPPGAFLQATAEGEAALREAVLSQLRPRDRVADLFAGIGTFSLAAADAGARVVHAVEADEAACRALAATRRQGVSVERRDLARRPLTAAELARFDLVILDPPRAGAEAQARELAAAAVPRIAYVSCDPESFARDARVLADGGYTLEGLQPVDQFLWSAEIELAARFTRSTTRRRA